MASDNQPLHLNDPVSITSTTDTEPLHGTVAHLGPVQFAPGSDWIGIKLTGSSIGKGKNDGSVKGIVYFDAGGDGNGMFVRRGNVVRLNDGYGEAVLNEKDVGSASGASSGDSVEKANAATTSVAAASRENFLRRLEQQQQKKLSGGNYSLGDTEAESKGGSVAAASSSLEEVSAGKETNVTAATTLTSAVSEDTMTQLQTTGTAETEASLSQGFMVSSQKEASVQPKSDIPRGNQNEDMKTVMSYLSTQSNLTSDLSSLDWIRDIDDSSLMLLKGLASSNHVSGKGAETLKLKGSGLASEAVSLQRTSSSPIGEAPLPVAERGTFAQSSFERASEDVTMGRMIFKAKTPTHDQAQSALTITGADQSSSIELSMLNMIEKQRNQMKEMQDRLLAMEEMMARMSCDMTYLRESQQRRDQMEGRVMGNVVGPMGMQFQRSMGSPTGLVGRGEVGRTPPPPPPPQEGQPSAVATAVNETAPNMNRPLIRGQDADQPFHRGIFFPLATYIFRCIKSFIANFRTALLSTGPGRIYAHLRHEAVRRRAFANVDLMALMKLVVMLLVFSGRMGRNDDRNRDRRGARRVQENNNEGGEEGISAIVAGIIQTAMTFLRARRMHVLVIASMIGFMVQTGLMAFFYEVFWVEREELLHVWLGRRNEAVGGDNNEANGNAQTGGPQQNINAQPAVGAGNQQAAAGQARAGPLPNPGGRGRNAQNNREANANRPAGGMIRRGPNGGFFHDIQCLIFSFILSLIPAWKPEEAAPPHDLQQRQQGQEENIEQQDGDAGNAGHVGQVEENDDVQ